MRAHEKKKLHRLMLRENVKKGLVNTASGGWTPNTAKNAMERDLKGGYRA